MILILFILNILICFIFNLALFYTTNKKIDNMDAEVTNHIKEKIKELMMEKNYNINSLALNCGLNSSALRMLYSGVTKSPSFDTIYKIATFFDCSIDELIGRSNYTVIEDKQDFTWDDQKYKEITDIAYPYIVEKNYKTTYNKVMSLTKEAYIFSMKSNNGIVDERIVKWVVDKNLDASLI